MRRADRFRVGIGIVLVGVMVAAVAFVVMGTYGPGDPELPALDYEARTGSRFLPLPANPFQAPTVRELTVPPFEGANAIWGATGRDSSGGIWIGVSA